MTDQSSVRGESAPPAKQPFHFDFVAYDDLSDPSQRWSTWTAVEPLCRGPEPWPSWLVTSAGAVDTDLGVLKTGKEADVHLIERADPLAPEAGVVMAAKRYRTADHRSFHRSAAYTEGRKMRNTRDARAIARKSAHGREVAAGQWAWAEWQALVRLYQLGVPVPYPVQLDGTEICMEWITEPAVSPDVAPRSAPRLAQARVPSTETGRTRLVGWYEQLVEALSIMVQAGIVHGDLSPYNVLTSGNRLVIIDVPQLVDLVGNPQGFDFLLRDCTNMCKWFASRGLAVDGEELFGSLVAQAF